MNSPAPNPNGSKKFTWLWTLAILLIIIIGGYLVWTYLKGRNVETPQVIESPAVNKESINKDLTDVNSNLQTLDGNYNQMDKIDESEDNTLSL